MGYCGDFHHVGKHGLDVLVVLCGHADAGYEVKAVVEGGSDLAGQGCKLGVAEFLFGGGTLECGSGGKLAVAFLGDLEAIDGSDAFCGDVVPAEGEGDVLAAFRHDYSRGGHSQGRGCEGLGLRGRGGAILAAGGCEEAGETCNGD